PLPAGAAPAGVPHARPPGASVPGRDQRLEQRPHRLLELQHPQGEPAAGRGGDASDAPAARAALRAPLLGGAPPDPHAGEVHPPVLRGGRVGDSRGDVSKTPWLVAGAAAIVLAAVLLSARPAAGAHPDPRPGITAQRVLTGAAVPGTPGAVEAYA